MIDRMTRNGHGAAEAPAPAPPRCWAFSARFGWHEADHPCAREGSGDDEDARRFERSGFYLIDRFGPEFSRFNMDVFRNHQTGASLAVLWLADAGEDVFLPDWPSLVAFLALALPALAASASLEGFEEAEREQVRRPRRK
jgi:hypothetical protein